jgi:hypothetical protein
MPDPSVRLPPTRRLHDLLAAERRDLASKTHGAFGRVAHLSQRFIELRLEFLGRARKPDAALDHGEIILLKS